MASEQESQQCAPLTTSAIIRLSAPKAVEAKDGPWLSVNTTARAVVTIRERAASGC